MEGEVCGLLGRLVPSLRPYYDFCGRGFPRYYKVISLVLNWRPCYRVLMVLEILGPLSI